MPSRPARTSRGREDGQAHEGAAEGTGGLGRVGRGHRLGGSAGRSDGLRPGLRPLPVTEAFRRTPARRQEQQGGRQGERHLHSQMLPSPPRDDDGFQPQDGHEKDQADPPPRRDLADRVDAEVHAGVADQHDHGGGAGPQRPPPALGGEEAVAHDAVLGVPRGHPEGRQRLLALDAGIRPVGAGVVEDELEQRVDDRAEQQDDRRPRGEARRHAPEERQQQGDVEGRAAQVRHELHEAGQHGSPKG